MKGVRGQAAVLFGAMVIASPANATTVTMTGVVPMRCETSFGQAGQNDAGRMLYLGRMTRRCTDGAGYRVILHTIAGLKGAVLLFGTRRIALSDSGDTVVVDSNSDLRADEPARPLFTLAPVATADFMPRLETVPKGPLY